MGSFMAPIGRAEAQLDGAGVDNQQLLTAGGRASFIEGRHRIQLGPC